MLECVRGRFFYCVRMAFCRYSNGLYVEGGECSLFFVRFCVYFDLGLHLRLLFGVTFFKSLGLPLGLLFLILGGGETDRKKHFAPLFLAVFRAIIVGNCTAVVCLLLIYITVKCLNYSAFRAFYPVFALFFVCMARF